MKRFHGRVSSLVLALLVFGCESKPLAPPPRIDTGAEKVANTFFQALLQEDWSTAYSTLDADSRTWCGKDQFKRLGENARNQLGFTPTSVGVSLTEVGEQASAIAVYRGVLGTDMKQFKDGTALRRTSAGWAIVLRKNFGIESGR